MRAPLVCRAGVVTDSPVPIDVDALRAHERGLDLLDSFADLVYGNRPGGSIDIELELDGEPGPLSVAATVTNETISSLSLED